MSNNKKMEFKDVNSFIPGNPYTLRNCGLGEFEIYKTDQIESLNCIWNFVSGNEESLKVEKEVKDRGIYTMVTRNGYIHNNIVLTTYYYQDAFKPNHKMSNIPAWSGFTIYEINDEGPTEVFDMHTSNNSTFQ